MIASPTNVLLADICARISQYFTHWPQPVDCAVHDGRFAPDELDKFVVRAPAVRVAALAAADALDSGGEPDGGELVTIDLRLAAVVIAADSPGTSRGEAARALADRIMYGIALESAWLPAAGDPREIRAGNLYNGKLDASKAIALWAVSWRQQVNARLADFEQVPPDTAELPNTVLAGFAPDVGTAHAADYDTVVAPERSAPATLAPTQTVEIGPVTLAPEAPAPAVLRSAVEIGPVTLAPTLTVKAPAPVALRSALAIGPVTLATRLAVEAPAPVALRSAVEIGPATLTAALTVEAPTGLGINSIPAQSNETGRALITAGPAGVWYSMFGGQSLGSYEGDLDIGLASTLTLDRIWWMNNSARDMRFNRNPFGAVQPGSGDDFNEWISEGSWAFYLLFEGLTEPLVLLVSDRRSVGLQYLNITATAEQAALLNTVGEGDLVNIVVADEPGGG